MKKLTHSQIGLMMMTVGGLSKIPEKREEVAIGLVKRGLATINGENLVLTLNGKIVVKAIIEQANRICRQKYSEIM